MPQPVREVGFTEEGGRFVELCAAVLAAAMASSMSLTFDSLRVETVAKKKTSLQISGGGGELLGGE